jgi:tetratricopeptide (TPR) repeat protein
LGRVWLSLAITHFYQWKYDEAAGDCARAIECGERSGDRGLVASARKWLGSAYLTSGAVDRAYETLEQALREARETKDTAGAGHVLASLGRAAMLKGDTERARAYLEEALSGLRAGGWLSEAARALGNLGAIEHILCRWDEAARRYTEALSLYQGLGFKAGCAAALINLSDNSQRRGWLEEALRQGREAISYGADDLRWHCHGMLCVARANYALGDLRSARRDALAALRISRAARLEGPTEIAERLLGEVSLLQGKPMAARKHLQRALAYNEKRGSRRWQAVCRARLAEVEMAAGDLQAAAILAQSACEVALGEGAESALALARSVRGRLRLHQGQPEEALVDLLTAERFFSGGRVHDELTELALQIGKANLQLGRLRFAALYFRTALDAVEQVAERLKSESNRTIFLSDPRRQEVFAAVRALREAAEAAVPDSRSGDEQG